MKISFVSNYRLTKVKHDETKSLNWLFLPGGPGMGAEYLLDFVRNLELSGSLFIGDFPGDGSNRNTNDISYNHWKIGLLETLKSLEPCILVTHSFSGMFALTIPEIEDIISGLVLVNSAPDNSWILEMANTQKNCQLPDLSSAAFRFYSNPTDLNLKLLFDATAPYLFGNHEMVKGQELLSISPYNAKTKLWADQNFHTTYKSNWIPSTLPTIIIGSNEDKLLPLKLFSRKEEWVRNNIEIKLLPETGHFPWLSHFKLINNILTNFEKGLVL